VRRSQGHQLGLPERALDRGLAVWPRPQIDASRIAWPMSARSASSSLARRPRRGGEPREQLLLADGPDAARDALAARLVAEERAIRRSVPTMSAVSSKTITTPEPSVAPIARVASNVSGVSSASGPTKTPAAPPSRTAGCARSPGTPPASSSSSRSVARTRPRRRPGARRGRDAEELRAGRALGADRLNASAPASPTISRTLTSVSTLLTTVGLPNSPTSTGNGGLLRGSPRLPSIDSKSAVSSPQM
jgi:hypothetical protein